MSNPDSKNPPQGGPKPPEGDDKADKKAKLKVVSERDLGNGQKVRVVTDGKRVWKESPEGSGMEPRA